MFVSTLENAFLISHGANVLFAIVFVFVTINLFQYSRIRLVLIMTGLMATWFITNLLLILPIIFDVTDPTYIELIATWNVIGSALVPALFILFIDAFEGKIDEKKVAVSFATIGAGTFVAISGLIGTIDLSSTIVTIDNLTTMRWSPITSIAIFPTIILAGIWTQQELKKSLIHAYDVRQISQIKYMRIGGILTFFVGPAWGIIGVILVDGFNSDVPGTWASEIIGYSFVSLGVFMVTIAYTRSKEIAFLQPQRIDTLLVIYGTGIPILQFDFNPNEKMQSDLPLVSGAITAITALMGEAFDVSSEIKEIAFHDKELILQFRKLTDSAEEIGFILIGERRSNFLENSITRFADNFVQSYDKELAVGLGLNEEDKDNARKLVKVAFGLEAD